MTEFARSASVIALDKKRRPSALKRVSYHLPNSALLGSPRKERSYIQTSESDEQMAACFLQYCAMCETQILTPCNSILYCSQACERKDSNKPLSAANVMATTPSPPMTPTSPRPILKPCTPTGLTPAVNVSSVRIPEDQHGFKSDLDPTEWKPKLPRESKPKLNRYDSEAFRYLSSFHRAINKERAEEDEDRCGVVGRGMVMTAPTTPSLGNTPTSVTAWSMSSSVGYGGISGQENYQRPALPVRHNRWFSSSSIGVTGIDLVTPHVAPANNEYAKMPISASSEAQRGHLGAFFGGQDTA